MRSWPLCVPPTGGIHALHQRCSVRWDKRRRTDSALSWDPSLSSPYRHADVRGAVFHTLVWARKKRTSSSLRASVFHEPHSLTYWPKQGAVTLFKSTHPDSFPDPNQNLTRVSDTIGWMRLSMWLPSGASTSSLMRGSEDTAGSGELLWSQGGWLSGICACLTVR